MSDTFASGSDRYAAARPLYPEALFDWIAVTAPVRGIAWDCATGNGQAAIGLASRFSQVEATDISEEQIGHGFAAGNVRYSAQPAEQTRFGDRSFDAVTVGQALHWFDHDRFWPELRRVARPGALFCAFGYAWFRGSEEVEQALLAPAARLVEPYWAANNRLLWDGYPQAELGFPFERLAAPDFRIELNWPLRDIVAYVRTWSAYKRAAAAGLEAELDAVIVEAERRLGTGRSFPLWVPVTILAGFVD